MKLLGKVAIVSMCLLSYVFNADAQRKAKVQGSYTYVQEEEESLKVAKAKAVMKAQTMALEEEFGTLIETINLTDIKDGKVKFRSRGLSEVRGTWLRDLQPPKFEYAMDEETGERVITVTVWGEAQEIVTSKIDIKAYVLRSEDIKRNVNDDSFYSDDQYFVSFSSPVDGYLAIYLMDENGDATRLLPYPNSTEAYPVKADKKYLFFSKNHIDKESGEDEDLREYFFWTDQMVEYNRMYIFFSKTEFMLPKDAQGVTMQENSEYQRPPMVNYEDMQNWIVKNRNRDKYMQVEQREITIHASSN